MPKQNDSQGGTKNRYQSLLEKIFFDHYKKVAKEVVFDRTELVSAARILGIEMAKNPGDVIYSVNNRALASRDELRDALKDKKSGDPLAFLVERDGQLIYVTRALE